MAFTPAQERAAADFRAATASYAEVVRRQPAQAATFTSDTTGTMTPERRRELLSSFDTGRQVLADEAKRAAASAPPMSGGHPLTPGARAMLAALPEGRTILAERAAATFSGAGEPPSARTIELLSYTTTGRGYLRSCGITVP
jgi:hypothetical protein